MEVKDLPKLFKSRKEVFEILRVRRFHSELVEASNSLSLAPGAV